MDTSIQGDPATALLPHQFRPSAITPGQIGLVIVEGERVAVFNVDGTYYATQERCVHASWPLSDGGELEGKLLTCPLHYWCYDVTTGEVVRGMKSLRLKVFRVTLDGDLGQVES
jgi:nitrite reductase/ring-hydroxylating ferredoxin subunit